MITKSTLFNNCRGWVGLSFFTIEILEGFSPEINRIYHGISKRIMNRYSLWDIKTNTILKNWSDVWVPKINSVNHGDISVLRLGRP